MAKAGLGKGNAFVAPGPSYRYMQLARTEEQQLAAAAESAGFVSEGMREKESALKAIADRIESKTTHDRVKHDMMAGIVRARTAPSGHAKLSARRKPQGGIREHRADGNS